MPDTAAAAARRQSGWGMTLKISLQFSVFSCPQRSAPSGRNQTTPWECCQVIGLRRAQLCVLAREMDANRRAALCASQHIAVSLRLATVHRNARSTLGCCGSAPP